MENKEFNEWCYNNEIPTLQNNSEELDRTMTIEEFYYLLLNCFEAGAKFHKKRIKTERKMKPIQRLKQLYKQQIKSEFTPKYKKQRAIYLTSREFCLSCELVTFQEVEQMEYEVDNELKNLVE